jgi:hypothetical protein
VSAGGRVVAASPPGRKLPGVQGLPEKLVPTGYYAASLERFLQARARGSSPSSAASISPTPKVSSLSHGLYQEFVLPGRPTRSW